MLDFFNKTIMNDDYMKYICDFIKVTRSNLFVLDMLSDEDYIVLSISGKYNILGIFLSSNIYLKLSINLSLIHLYPKFNNFWFAYDFYESDTENEVSYKCLVSKKFINSVEFHKNDNNIDIFFKDDRFKVLRILINNNSEFIEQDAKESFIQVITDNLDFEEKSIIYKKLEEADIL